MEAAAAAQQLSGHGAWRDTACGAPRTVTGSGSSKSGSALFRKSGQHLPRLSVGLDQRRLGHGLAASQQGLLGGVLRHKARLGSSRETGPEAEGAQLHHEPQGHGQAEKMNGAASNSSTHHSASDWAFDKSESESDWWPIARPGEEEHVSTSSSKPLLQHQPRSRAATLHRSATRVRRPAAPVRLAELWKEVQGSRDWKGLLEPELHPALRSELVRYGEFAQACYDAFDGDTTSRYCGSCLYDQDKMLEAVGLPDTGYRVTKYIYATSQDLKLVPPALWASPAGGEEEVWSKDSNWVGFVAVCAAEGEIARLGRRDILVAWRGTVTSFEWKENMRDWLTTMQPPSPGREGPGSGGLISTDSLRKGKVPLVGGAEVEVDVKVERGFYRMYTSRTADSRYNDRSAKQQVMDEVRRLVEEYGREELSITVTGHSLGGALALLCAHDLAEGDDPVNRYSFRPKSRGPDALKIPVTVFNFAAPRVGNEAFRQRLEQLGVKVLRVVNERDTVPRLPGMVTNEKLPWLCAFLDWLPWTYSHVGHELRLNSSHSTCLDHKKNDLLVNHNMDLYLHLLDAFRSRQEPFGNFDEETSRDVALLNKYCDILHKKYRVPPCWWQQQNKGLVFDKFAQRWRQRERDPDDIPVNIDRRFRKHPGH